MKIQTLIVAGAAAFALLAPAAGAAGNKSARHVGPADQVTGHRLVKHNRTTGSKASKPAKVTTLAKSKPAKPVKPATRVVPYIYVPGPTTPAPAYVDPNGCADSGTDCTDQELCDYWGENCDSLPPAGQQDPDAAGTTTTSTDPTAG